MSLIVIYHFTTSIIPFVFSDDYGATIESHFIYACFSFFTFVIEYVFIKDILGKILHLTPGFYVPVKSATLM